MWMGPSWKKYKQEMGVGKTAIFVATEPGAAFALSVMNCVANTARIRDSWTDRSYNYCRGSSIDHRRDIESSVNDFAGRRDAKCTLNRR